MKKILVALLIVSLLFALQSPVWAKEKVKIAVMHSVTGGLALAGGLAGQRGSLVAIDMWNARGGILNKYDIVPVEADAQSSPDVAIREAFKAFPSLQWVTAVDTDVNIYDSIDVEWAITTRFNAKKGFILLPDEVGHILNPMVDRGKVTKFGIDATAPYPRTPPFERVKFKDVNLKSYDIKELYDACKKAAGSG